MRIGIDLDDVLVDFISEFTDIAHEMYGRPELGTKPVDWEWSNFGLSKEEQRAVWNRIVGSYNFWEVLSMETGASRRGMKLLLDQKHDLIFITARATTEGRTVQEQSARWLAWYFGINYPTVIVDTNKGPLAAALKLDYFIDDRPKNCIEIKEAVPSCKVFLKNSSHNAAYGAPAWMNRVATFDDFVDVVRSNKQ